MRYHGGFPILPGMRYLVCLIVGLAIGAITASIATNALARRHAVARGLMNLMQHELGAARGAVRANQCTAPAIGAAAAHLRLLAADVEPVLLGPGGADRVFSQYAGDLRDAIAKWNPAAACPQQAAALTEVAHACDACHRDYR